MNNDELGKIISEAKERFEKRFIEIGMNAYKSKYSKMPPSDETTTMVDCDSEEIDIVGIWSDTLNAFWCGANDIEFIAWSGSHQIFVYPAGEYPNPPSGIIQWNKRIESVEEFDLALKYGIRYEVKYTFDKDKNLPKDFDGVYCSPREENGEYDEDAMMSYAIQKYKNGGQMLLSDEEIERFRRNG